MMEKRWIKGVMIGFIMMVGTVGTAAAFPTVFLGGSTAASMLDDRPVGEATVSASLRASSWFDVQLSGTAIHPLERSYDDDAGRPYQSETAWSGIGIRPFITLGERVEIGFPIETATGVMQFRYERPYRDEVAWTEEIIDRETIAVNSIGIDLDVRLSDHWAVRAEAGGRVSSPIRTVTDVDEDALNSWYAGIGAVYRLSFDS